MIRATCCNWDVEESEIVFSEVQSDGEVLTCCRECSDDAMREAYPYVKEEE